MLDARGAQRVGLGDGEAFGFGELGQPFERFGIVVYEQEMGHLWEVVRGKGKQLQATARNLRTSLAP